MLTGVPRITRDDKTGRIALSLETVVRDVVCDLARVVIAGDDDETFNALDDVGCTLEAIDLDVTEDYSQQVLAERLFGQLDTVMRLLGVETEIVMGPHTARALGEALCRASESVVASA